jgi:AhpD family alkylhydroperoxidase
VGPQSDAARSRGAVVVRMSPAPCHVDPGWIDYLQENMSTRIGPRYSHIGQPLMAGLRQATEAVRASGLPHGLLDLVYLRASQLNGCGFCVEMHVAEAGRPGEAAERLHALGHWRHSGRFSEREKAALAWTEALTRLEGGVADELYTRVSEIFSEEEMVALTHAVGMINVWNRLNVAFGSPPEKGLEAVTGAGGK